MDTIRIGPDCATATGIATFIRNRVEELKAEAENSTAQRGLSGHRNELIIRELLAVGEAIEVDIDRMIDDMYAQDQERAREQAIQLDDMGLTVEQVKKRYEF